MNPWQPIATAPKDRLIDVWVRERDGRGYRLASAYHDAYCEEWRTSRPDSRLVAVKAWHCTHWMPIPEPPPIDVPADTTKTSLEPVRKYTRLDGEGGDLG